MQIKSKAMYIIFNANLLINEKIFTKCCELMFFIIYKKLKLCIH